MKASNVPVNVEFGKIQVHCLECEKEIERTHLRIKKNGKLQFCSVKCSNVWRGKNGGKDTGRKEKACPNCEERFVGITKYCGRNCSIEGKRLSLEITLEEYGKDDTVINMCRRLRSHARSVLRNLGIGQICCSCGYNLHVECCHIKPIAEFPLIATIGEVNDFSNLMYLCPNCHWELDNGFLDIDDIKKQQGE